ncbi:MAG TPA: B12-binding domain-containing radical SAM protein [Bacteroidales bacterium]|nr:B12-binding domain-containing radical SAM protein [Bacteroidales bacterium]HPS49290.1 B12-binding domain-containing radical SAM protein [Bacteroidales bacterium]
MESGSLPIPNTEVSGPVLLLTTPFTQLNTPYPATPFLKGFLNTRNIVSYQCDLGIGVILELFSTKGLTDLFKEAECPGIKLSSEATRMLQLRECYFRTIDPVMNFLQNSSPEMAHAIASRKFLPEGPRFSQLDHLEKSFGRLGLQDKAKHLATCYLEDISDLIKDHVDPFFGFSRYAESLGRSASSFDALEDRLVRPPGFIDRIMTGLLEKKLETYKPRLTAISIPFPGNLYSALRCGKWIKENHPSVKIAMGGGFVNTELRFLSDPRVFNYVDFITLDDGESPLLHLLGFLNGSRELPDLKRTFIRSGNAVIFANGSQEADISMRDKGVPDYTGLPLKQYLSVLEVANPMHRMWSDGFWNKLMLAHGCYWAKCTFCDTDLDYIKRYEPCRPVEIVDRMEALISQTGRRGFHFVDEAAPPALLKDIALEIIRRHLTVVWWTNIRFEKRFTADLCRLLKKSGCIAVSGGLEVASPRILKMIGKGVTVEQVATVTHHFSRAGIMVHAYLMYGFPTQTEQETIDSLEIVRQLFRNRLVQSAYWHQFALTVHSRVGIHPEAFGIAKVDTPPGTFTNNDLIPVDRKGCRHEIFGEGLKRSLYNYMHGLCLDFPLREWFGFPVPPTTVNRNFIRNVIRNESVHDFSPDSRMIWIEAEPRLKCRAKNRKGEHRRIAVLQILMLTAVVEIQMEESLGNWLMALITDLMSDKMPLTVSAVRKRYESAFGNSFEEFLHSGLFEKLRETGLLIL